MLTRSRDTSLPVWTECGGVRFSRRLGVGVAVAAVEWDEDAGEIRLQPDKAEEAQLLLGGKQPDLGRHSAVGGRAGAPEDAREGHLSAEQPRHRAYPTSLSVLSVGSFRPGNPGLCGKPLAACPKY